MAGSGETASTATGIIGCGAITSVVLGKLEMTVFVIFSTPGTVTFPWSMVIPGTTGEGVGSGSGSGFGCLGGVPVLSAQGSYVLDVPCYMI